MQKELKDKIYYLLSDVEKSEPIPKKEFDKVLERFDFNVPETYKKIMRDFNGGEGEVGIDSWVDLFPADELQQVNEDYKILMEDIPDYFLFGKDAADTGYAFHKVNGTFHSFGLMSNFHTDSIEFMGTDFVEFLEWLNNYKYED